MGTSLLDDIQERGARALILVLLTTLRDDLGRPIKQLPYVEELFTEALFNALELWHGGLELELVRQSWLNLADERDLITLAPPVVRFKGKDLTIPGVAVTIEHSDLQLRNDFIAHYYGLPVT